MKHLSTFVLVLVCATSHAAYQRLATETYPGGGSGSTNGVTTAQVTNIWNAIAADRMVPQYDDNVAMTATESMFLTNMLQVGDTSDPMYVYATGMAGGVKVAGSDAAKSISGDATVGPGGVYVTDGLGYHETIMKPDKILVDGKDVVYGISTNGTDYVHGNIDLSGLIGGGGASTNGLASTAFVTNLVTTATNDLRGSVVTGISTNGADYVNGNVDIHNFITNFVNENTIPHKSDTYGMLEIPDAITTGAMYFMNASSEFQFLASGDDGLSGQSTDGNYEIDLTPKEIVIKGNAATAVDFRMATFSPSNIVFKNNAGTSTEVGFDGIRYGGTNIVYGISTNGTDYMHGNVDLSGLVGGGGGGAYLPLAGGTLTGDIKFSGTDGSALKIGTATDKNYLEICAASGGVTSHNGSFLALTGKDNPSESASNKGRFRLGVGSTDGTRNIALMGYPDGRLKWNSTNIVLSVNGAFADNGGAVDVSSMTNGVAYFDDTTNRIMIAELDAKSYADQYGGQAPDYAAVSNAAMTAAETATNAVMHFVNTDVCWSKPNLWCLEFQLGYTATVVGHVSTVTNDYGAIYETKSVTYAYGNYADLYPEVYDEYHLDPVIVTNYTCTTTGGTISPAGRLTTTGDGVYHCIATDANGVSSAVDVPIQNTLQEIVDTPIYAADVNPSDRKTSNDDAKTLMTSPTSAGTGTYEGITYNIWNFFTQPVWAATQAGSVGNTKAFALGTTVMASAAHYAWHSGGTQVVGGTTVTKGAAERLYDWALAHGWTKAQLDDMNIRDIEVIPLTAGTIPTSDLPYLMTEAQLDASYGSLAGVQCWTAVQAFAQPITRVYTSAYGTSWSNYYESRSQTAVKPWRDDLTTLITALGTTYPVHSGDSGHPIYFKDASGRYVLTSHYNYVGGGPNYIKGFPVIKAYVEAHGGTVREIP